MRLIRASRRVPDERLLWSRDIRFVHRLAAEVPLGRAIELDTGIVLIAPADILTDADVAEFAVSYAEELASRVPGTEPVTPDYGIVTVDDSALESDRYLLATAAAVQISGLAERIGMAQSTQVVQTKMLDYFFSLRKMHEMAFQPIVTLATGEVHEYECLFRPEMPMLPQSIASVVGAALNTGRGVELDTYIVATVVERIGRVEAVNRGLGRPPRRYAVNVTPISLLDPAFDVGHLVELARAADLDPRQLTIECTEQQSVTDVSKLQRQTKALRRAGFGFAIDDAGAGYASFALIAALHPSVIKVDRDICHGIGHNEAKQALVEAFVSFGRRIGADLVAEGIERRADLEALKTLGVAYGQGYLLGRPAPEPGPARKASSRARTVRSGADAVRSRAAAVRAGSRVPSGA